MMTTDGNRRNKGITKRTRGKESRKSHSRFQTPVDDEKRCGEIPKYARGGRLSRIEMFKRRRQLS